MCKSELEAIYISETEAATEFREKYPEVAKELIDGFEFQDDDWEFAESLGNRYEGKFESERAYAIHVVEEIFAVKTDTFPMTCMDYNKVWREMRIDGTLGITDRNGDLHVFSAG